MMTFPTADTTRAQETQQQRQPHSPIPVGLSSSSVYLIIEREEADGVGVGERRDGEEVGEAGGDDALGPRNVVVVLRHACVVACMRKVGFWRSKSGSWPSGDTQGAKRGAFGAHTAGLDEVWSSQARVGPSRELPTSPCVFHPLLRHQARLNHNLGQRTRVGAEHRASDFSLPPPVSLPTPQPQTCLPYA